MRAQAGVQAEQAVWRAGLLSRRCLLRVGGMGLLGLTLPRLLQARERSPRLPQRIKSVVFLFQFGGPTHLDTFDLKPQAPEQVRGQHRPIATSVPGVSVCEHLPRLAKVMHLVTQVRTLHHRMKNHNPAAYTALTGHEPPVDDIRLRDTLELYPAYGSVVDHLAPNTNAVPTFVAYPYVIRDGAITPGQHASFLGKQHDPFLFTEDPNAPDFRLPELTLPQGMSLARLEDRRRLQQLIARQTRLLDQAAEAAGMDAYYRRALEMLNSRRLREAFDLGAEPEKLRRQYTRTTYGQCCLLARRLVEAGVKFVTVYFSRGIGGQSTTRGGWDTHGFNNTRMYPIIQKYHLPLTDRVLSTFLEDLHSRGLLDETLVVWMGEFGRTPRLNKNVSRDHWPYCYTALLAGGGLKAGYVHGASDRHGAFPDRDPVHVGDLAATLFYLLGIDPATEVYDVAQRPLAIAEGRPVLPLLG